MRLFVSVDLPDAFADAVRSIQADLATAAGVDPTDPTQAHVTLKFLGETRPDRLSDLESAIQRAVDDADVEPFEAAYGGLGVFPSTDYIRVIWLGVRDGRGADEMTRLHRAIEAETTAIGFSPEDHAFTPHVTIARMRHAGGKEHVQRIVDERDPDVGTATVEGIALTESELGDDGPEYSTVERFPLAGNG